MNTAVHRRQLGFTLVELMVGLVLGLLVTSALFWIYVGNVRTTSDSVKAARLNNDLRAAMELMVSDIRRAGYWENVVIPGTGVTNLFTTINPFMDPANGTDIVVANMTGEAADSCITYTYDANQDGNVNLGSPPPPREGYGFRLNTGAVQIRRGGTLSLGNLDCNDGLWEAITDPDFVTITDVTFRVAGAAGAPSTSCQNLSDATCGGDGDDTNSCGDDAAVPEFPDAVEPREGQCRDRIQCTAVAVGGPCVAIPPRPGTRRRAPATG